MKVSGLLFGLFFCAFSERRGLQNPTEPVPCDIENPGLCDCSSEEGFQTYTYWEGQQQKCFTVYVPTDIIQPAPVVLHMQCYARASLQRLSLYPGSDMVSKADRWGFILVGLSDPHNRNWNFPSVNNLVEGVDACDESKSRGLRYAKKVYEFLESEEISNLVDQSRIYTEGFSQNGNFAAYIGYCMRDKTAMVLQGGSGLHVINNGRLLRRNGLAENFPEGISYPMKLSPEATNYNTCTFIVNGDQWADSAYNMEYWMLQNGLDIRFFEFDGQGHRWPRFNDAWWVGCSGMHDTCSEECENSFKECVANNNRVQSGVQSCLRLETMESLQGCTRRCAPTLEMLQIYEQPNINLSHGKFGRPVEEPETTESIIQECDMDALAAEIALVQPKARDLGYRNRCNPLYNSELKEFWFGLSMLQSGSCTQEQIEDASQPRWIGRRLIPELAECLLVEVDSGDCDLDMLAEQASEVEGKVREFGWRSRCDVSQNENLRNWWFQQDMLSSGVCSQEFIEAKAPRRFIGTRLIPELIGCLQN